ncbi:MAG: GAF domain-containing protein [Symploca sp. SIO2B6]|nr:GAF domain-containing protein [Symploca sp. SIO2B6]
MSLSDKSQSLKQWFFPKWLTQRSKQQFTALAITFGAAQRAIAWRYPLKPSGHSLAGIIAFSAGAIAPIAMTTISVLLMGGVAINQTDKHHGKGEDLVTYISFEKLEGRPEFNGKATITTPTVIALEPTGKMLVPLSVGMGLIAFLGAILATTLAQRLRKREEEVVGLDYHLREIRDKLETLRQDQQAYLEQLQLLADVAKISAQAKDRTKVFNLAVRGAQQWLGVDRVVVYGFEPDYSGNIIAEAVAPNWVRVLTERVTDHCIPGNILEEYKQGRVVANSDIYATSYSPEHIQLLEQLQVKANLIVPIIVNDNLLGLLVTHQCSSTREWKQPEINFLQQLAIQVGLALTSITLAAQTKAEAERYCQLNAITTHLRQSLNPEDIYHIAITRVRKTLKTDRVLVYLFDQNWYGTIVAEEVGHGWPKALGVNIADPCFANYVEHYKKGRVKAFENIYKAGLSECHLAQLQPFKVKANLVAPILAYGELYGLLVTHQCSCTRSWQESEITFFKQVAILVSSALDQVAFLKQQEQARITAEAFSKEKLQQQQNLQLKIVELLRDLYGAAEGDLTVHADVVDGEIGAVAEFFNYIIESLRRIVTKVQQSALQVNTAINEDEQAIRQFAQETFQQAEDTSRTLESVEQMTRSIQEVARSANQAAIVSRKASNSAIKGVAAVRHSVEHILNLQETMTETTKQVKQLGRSSQQISKVVSLIEQIAMQTNLLAINTGIEAARAGKTGEGFGVVAEEVSELAAQCAVATKEIEGIITNIQRETFQVVQAMEKNTEQVIAGTHLVENVKQSLEEIVGVSTQIDQLVRSISEVTVSQTQTSEAVSELMCEIALRSVRSSDVSEQICGSLKQTLEVAEELQESVKAFKVEQGREKEGEMGRGGNGELVVPE